jgi:quinoprotein glucose dehydrogenase
MERVTEPAPTLPQAKPPVVARVAAVLMVLVGAALALGGAELARLGGSLYYLLSGLVFIATAVLLWRARRDALLLFFGYLLATIVWALWEVGVDGWALMPRLVMPVVVAAILVFVCRSDRFRPVAVMPTPRRAVTLSGVVVLPVIAVLAGLALHAAFADPVRDPAFQAGVAAFEPDASGAPATKVGGSGDWTNYGNDVGGNRFSGLDQITPGNVAKLKRAWVARLGPAKVQGLVTSEATPLEIDDALYLCTGDNRIISVDARTGKTLWREDLGINDDGLYMVNCRGVAYYKAAAADELCGERILTNTVDARLIALDRRTGKRCPDFGTNGEVSLRTGMGEIMAGYYFATSAPTVVRGKVVLGGWVADGQHWGEPSGVIRAFDATTGELAWAFDMGRPEATGLPPEGETYTRSTPNSWAPTSADEELGLVFVPTGNATPDYFGAQRRDFDDKYSSSVIAIDVETGRPRWSFQTVHHDLWDYDVASQPTLADIRIGGQVRKALIQTTKRGEIFVLDRRDGTPILPVVERPVPQTGKVPEERLSPTQPFSPGMPSLRGTRVTERDMWGISPLDQLWCRIQFKRARYDGIFTPPGLTPSIMFPGYLGGSNWGGVTFDASRQVMVLNTSYIGNYMQLVPRAEADKLGLKPRGHPGGSGDMATMVPQSETPYAARTAPFWSPLRLPCQAPPYGKLTGIDMTTGKLLWQRRIGTGIDSGPFGIRSFLPLTIGTPTQGGAITTASGLTFIAATHDNYIRAFDTRTGKQVWQDRLPAGGQATPMTYTTRDGKQFLVIMAGGHPILDSTPGDYLIAYALN